VINFNISTPSFK